MADAWCMAQLHAPNDNPAAIAPGTELLTPTELARVLKTTPQTIGRKFHAGEIPARIHSGRIIRFHLEEVMETLKPKQTP